LIRVFVLWKHPLFHETIRLLLHHPDIDLSGAAIDDADSREKLDAHQPEILILERSASGDRREETPLGLLDEDVRVIWLSLDDNVLSEFTRHNHTVQHRDDLLGLVLEDHSGTGR
jgi:chemotaxis response regulator CheB